MPWIRFDGLAAHTRENAEPVAIAFMLRHGRTRNSSVLRPRVHGNTPSSRMPSRASVPLPTPRRFAREGLLGGPIGCERAQASARRIARGRGRWRFDWDTAIAGIRGHASRDVVVIES